MTARTKYEQLQAALKAELASGKFRTGDRFYTEREIMEKYQVSGITVARALAEMTKQGYFERKRKLGTFILESPKVPGMTGIVMTQPLYLNRVNAEDSDRVKNAPAWFVVEDIRRGIINSYPGAVRIVDIEEIIVKSRENPNLSAILMPQRIPNYQEYRQHNPANTVEIILPPNVGEVFNSVRPNYLTGVYEAMEHLIQTGRTRIAFYGIDNARNRYAAYRIALETYNMPLNPDWVIRFPDQFNTDLAHNKENLKALLTGKNPPDAIFCSTDKQAMQVMALAKQLGLRVPEDLAVIGFDDLPEGKNCEVPLATVHVPYYSLGKAAVELLFERLSTGKNVPTKILQTHFVLRHSAAGNF